MIIKRDQAFMAVCEFRTPVGIDQEAIGTGVFINTPAGNNAYYGWIVTATHVAIKTNQLTHIVISTKEGTAAQLPLSLFGPISNWRHHPVADMSAFQVVFNKDNEKFVEGRFFPIDHINLSEQVVSRDDELTSIGFPKGMGIDGLFSPFTFRSYASSGFVTLKRADTNTECIFFCLENPSVGGYSGCPVFDLGYTINASMMVTKEKTVCHGIMHGTISDETGGKIAVVTPMFYLLDIVDMA